MINILRTSIIPIFLISLFGCSDTKSKELASDMAFVDSLMARMTLEEKLGQMTQVDRQFLSDISDISKYGLGSLLSGGGSTPEVNEPKAWADMYDSYQREALKSRLKIPLIYGIDAVHGHNNVVGATIFPHNIGLGATRDPQIVEAVARATALEVAATGIDWDFAPCLAVPDDFRWGRTYEGFSENTELVSELGGAAVRGYQSAEIDNPNGVLACAKHFIGDGGVAFGTGINSLIDQGDLQIDEEERRDLGRATMLAKGFFRYDARSGILTHTGDILEDTESGLIKRMLEPGSDEQLRFSGTHHENIDGESHNFVFTQVSEDYYVGLRINEAEAINWLRFFIDQRPLIPQSLAGGKLDNEWVYVSLLSLNVSIPSCICLLYTSPSPRDRTRSRMPSSA